MIWYSAVASFVTAFVVSIFCIRGRRISELQREVWKLESQVMKAEIHIESHGRINHQFAKSLGELREEIAKLAAIHDIGGKP